MDKISLPKLTSCRFCGKLPKVRMNVGIENIPKDNPMYSFSISHECGGFTCNHTSLFFQNKSTKKSCWETLRQSAKLYSKLWNKRHSTDIRRNECQ